ncbi:MAG: hypothetical protein IIZ25_05400 [Thermoguttaceae bacterium]|nr:hypothetical protein [Thermoguttaceae bacterium]
MIKPIRRDLIPRMILTVVLLSIGTVFAENPIAADTDAMTADALFEKHEAALEKTRRIKLRYKITENRVEREYLWIESGEEKFLQPIEESSDRWTNDKPTYFTHGGAFFRAYLNAEHLTTYAPKSFAESLDNGYCFTRCRDTFNWELESPRRLIFFSPVLGQSGTSSTLRETFFNSPWQSEPKQSTNDRGEVLWTVFSSGEPLTDEEMSLANPKKGWMMIQFNQTKGFWVECFALFVPAFGRAGEGQDTEGPVSLVFGGCVAGYKDIASDLAIPGKIIHRCVTAEAFRQGIGRDESIEAGTLLEVLDGAIDDESIRVPEVPIRQYVKVFRDDLLDEKIGDEGVFAPVSFWGKDDAPEVTFLSSEEKQYDAYVRQRYYEEQPLPESGFSSISPWRIVLLGIGLALVVASLVLKRHLSAA